MSAAPLTASIVPPITLTSFNSHRFAIDSAALLMTMPVFAHRPMGTQF